MKVLFVTNGRGGAAVALRSLLSGLQEAGCTVGVVLPESAVEFRHQIEALVGSENCFAKMDFPLTVYPKAVLPWKVIRRYKALATVPMVREYVAEVIEEFRPDIVHTNAGPLDYAFEACLRKNIPHVWHIRETQEGMRFYKGGRKRFLSLVSSPSNTSIAVSRYVAAKLGLPEANTEVIYDAVPDHWTGSPSHRKNYFLYVGGIERRKGLLMVLRAFRKFSKEGAEGHSLKVAGRSFGLYTTVCRAYARLHSLDVEFLGEVESVTELFSEASAYITASSFDGFGLTAAEAALALCPVIGRNLVGTREQADNLLSWTGEEAISRFTTVGELASLMKKAATAPCDEDLLQKARKAVLEHYSVKTSASEVVKVYKKALEEHGR